MGETRVKLPETRNVSSEMKMAAGGGEEDCFTFSLYICANEIKASQKSLCVSGALSLKSP